MTLSLIIPIYNAAPYLRRCLDSVLAQTYTDFECLLVDDGSTDGSLQICLEYAAQDPHFQVFHKENGGEADARNFGVRQAQGDYICWLDADDELLPAYLQMLAFAQQSFPDTDLVFFGITRVYGDIIQIVNPIKMGIACYKLPKEANNMFAESNIRDFGVSPSKLFRRSIIINNKLLYSSDIRVAVDLDFLLRYLAYSSTIVVSAHSDYLYHQLPDTLSHSNYSFHQELSGLCQLSKSWQLLSRYIGPSATFENQRDISIADYTHRVILASYGAGLSRFQRVENHRRIPQNYIKIYGRSFRPTRFLGFISILFAHNLYQLADFILFFRFWNK